MVSLNAIKSRWHKLRSFLWEQSRLWKKCGLPLMLINPIEPEHIIRSAHTRNFSHWSFLDQSRPGIGRIAGEGGDLKAGSAPTLAVVRAPEPRWLMWGTIVACRVHCGQHQAPIDKWFQDWDYRRAALCRSGAACCSPPLCAAWEDKPGFGVIQNINMSQAAAWDNIAMVNWSNGTDISLRIAVPFQCPLKKILVFSFNY